MKTYMYNTINGVRPQFPQLESKGWETIINQNTLLRKKTKKHIDGWALNTNNFTFVHKRQVCGCRRVKEDIIKPSAQVHCQKNQGTPVNCLIILLGPKFVDYVCPKLSQGCF